MRNRVVSLTALAIGGAFLYKKLISQQNSGEQSTVNEAIDVNVPVRKAYNQWTQFEEFPLFMKSVQQIRQINEKRLSWRAMIGGEEKEWEVEISEQIPDKRIAWHSTTGVRNAGVVTFHKLSDSTTRIMLQMDYQPEGVLEQVGDALGVVKKEARANLQSFKQLIEERGAETGAWRGTITDGAIVKDGAAAKSATNVTSTANATSPSNAMNASAPIRTTPDIGKPATQP